MNPFVNIHTHHNHIDNKEFIEIKNIDVDESVVLSTVNSQRSTVGE